MKSFQRKEVGMTSDEKRTFFQCLFSIAWADGAIGTRENAILATLFNTVALEGTARDEVERWFHVAPPEPDWSVPAGDREMRRALVEQVFLVAMADRVVNAPEIALLEKVRDRVGMGNDEFQEIAVDVERILAT